MKLAIAFCLLTAAVSPSFCQGAIQVLANYRLGEDDPGAGPTNIGQNPTFDSGPNHLNLTREGTPHYASDVGTPASTVSMQFNPGTLDVYYRDPITTLPDNVGLEAWVKSSAKANGNSVRVIAFNGAPGTNGFGLVRVEKATPLGGVIPIYEAFVGTTAVGQLAVPDNKWLHLAIVIDGGKSTFYVNGQPGGSATADPGTETMAFSIGAAFCPICDRPVNSSNYLDGLVDEVKLFSFSPGNFNASTDLAFNVPEPTLIGWLILSTVLMGRHRKSVTSKNAGVN